VWEVQGTAAVGIQNACWQHRAQESAPALTPPIKYNRGKVLQVLVVRCLSVLMKKILIFLNMCGTLKKKVELFLF
jgi:hypothetical protein